MYYFLITTLIIYPTAVLAAVLGIVGGTRYRHQRAKIGSFDAAQVWDQGLSFAQHQPHRACEMTLRRLLVVRLCHRACGQLCALLVSLYDQSVNACVVALPGAVAGSRVFLELLPHGALASSLGMRSPEPLAQSRCASQSVEVTKLLAVVATLLTACAFIAWTIISSVWVSRKQACTGARHWPC